MSTEIDDDIDEVAVVNELEQLASEFSRDQTRLNTLLRNKTLHDPVALANEVVQTIYPVVSDAVSRIHEVAVVHQQGIMELEEAVYNQTPKAMEALLSTLCEKKIIEPADQVRILAILATEESESLLSAVDSALILEQLENYEKLLSKEANGQLSPLQNVIARVREITIGDEEDLEDEGEIESTGTTVEEAEA